MFRKISEKIIAYAVKTKEPDANKAEEYIYGLELIFSVLTSYISILVIGLLFGMFPQSVLFLFVFTLVRRFAGGFHFGSQLLCWLTTCGICTFVLLVVKYTKDNAIAFSVIMAISTLVLLLTSPVPAVEKPLDDREKFFYGRISRVIIITLAVIYAILCRFGQIYTAKIISVTVLVTAVLAILGIIKHRLYENKKVS